MIRSEFLPACSNIVRTGHWVQHRQRRVERTLLPSNRQCRMETTTFCPRQTFSPNGFSCASVYRFPHCWHLYRGVRSGLYRPSPYRFCNCGPSL
jgi:hypothetical protein